MKNDILEMLSRQFNIDLGKNIPVTFAPNDLVQITTTAFKNTKIKSIHRYGGADGWYSFKVKFSNGAVGYFKVPKRQREGIQVRFYLTHNTKSESLSLNVPLDLYPQDLSHFCD